MYSNENNSKGAARKVGSLIAQAKVHVRQLRQQTIEPSKKAKYEAANELLKSVLNILFPPVDRSRHE
jgi:hypothetical protein